MKDLVLKNDSVSTELEENQVISVFEKDGKQLVSVRELHQKLEITHRFNDWFISFLKYGFEENLDFTSVQTFTLVNNGAKKPIEDYQITLEMAK